MTNRCRPDKHPIYPPSQSHIAVDLFESPTAPTRGSQQDAESGLERNSTSESSCEETSDLNGWDLFEEVPDVDIDPLSSQPSSSVLLFARLTTPRIDDRTDEQSGLRRAAKAVLPQPAPPPYVGEQPTTSLLLTQLSETVQTSILQPQSMSSSSIPSSPQPRLPRGVASVKEDGSSFSVSDEDPNADLSLESTDPSGAKMNFGARRNSGALLKGGDYEGGTSDRSPSYATKRFSGAQEVAYRIADSGPSFVFVFWIILLDASLFLAAFLYLLNKRISRTLSVSLVVMDIVTAVVYCSEVNLRLFSYGPAYYFHSLTRSIDYLVGVTNATLVTATLTFAGDIHSLLIVRYIRLFRMLTVTVLTRERRLKAQAMADLEELALLLDEERSDQNRLIKWRIDSNAIAMGEAAGRGGFGAVFLGLFRGTLVAVKQLYQNNEKAGEYTSIEDEAVTLVNLRHPNVVLFMGFVHEPRKLWIVTEYCSPYPKPYPQICSRSCTRPGLLAWAGSTSVTPRSQDIEYLDIVRLGYKACRLWPEPQH
jgi:hypothetical protein